MSGPVEAERELARALLSRAEDERRRILTEAKAEARRIRGEAERQVGLLRDERLREARGRAERKVGQEISEARFDELSAETRLLDEGLARALARAQALLGEIRQGQDYPALLARLAEECLLEFPSGSSLRLVVDPRDQRALPSFGASVEVEPGGAFLGGVQAIDESGRQRVDNTFEARLRARASEIRRVVLRIFTAKVDE